MLNLYVKAQVFALTNREKGQSLAEYALILALVAVACIGGLNALGAAINGRLTGVAGTIGG